MNSRRRNKEEDKNNLPKKQNEGEMRGYEDGEDEIEGKRACEE